jgi:hypothetical protein
MTAHEVAAYLAEHGAPSFGERLLAELDQAAVLPRLRG